MAAITDDFAPAADEVNPVIAALRAHGIEVTALHSHMLDEEPRLPPKSAALGTSRKRKRWATGLWLDTFGAIHPERPVV